MSAPHFHVLRIMDVSDALTKLTAIAHEGRLAIFRLLVRRAPDHVPAGEIALALGVRGSTLSNQLTELERAGLIASERKGRSIRYRAELDAIGGLLGFLGNECCGGRPEACLPVAEPFLQRSADWRRDARAASEKRRVLFVCRGNSARSILAEALLNRLGGGRFEALSAGARPKGALHPRTVDLLRAQGDDPARYRSTSWEAYAEPGAAPLDIVVTVCDDAANETSPIWPGRPISAHWSAPDPSAAGDAADVERAFAETYEALERRIAAFVALPLDALDSLCLQRRLDGIGLAAPATRLSETAPARRRP